MTNVNRNITKIIAGTAVAAFVYTSAMYAPYPITRASAVIDFENYCTCAPNSPSCPFIALVNAWLSSPLIDKFGYR